MRVRAERQKDAAEPPVCFKYFDAGHRETVRTKGGRIDFKGYIFTDEQP